MVNEKSNYYQQKKKQGGTNLGRVDVARRPSHVRTETDERLDQDGGLRVHVRAADDVRTLERFVVERLLAQRHDARHLLLRDLDLVPPERVLLDVADAEVRIALRVLLHLVARRQVVLLRAALGVRTWRERWECV